ncbi:flagellar type III secretion system protein FlhA [Lysobacter pythonis]|uniref:Flagellar type III secretion system protein FlhA n=1 Tax=Solilutibacter pythonis TaxID=2483112 RepID=A0A3M2I4B9_9GAMM|nr:flagellar biosynthesis protein FlhA [Lysobacter pythonis]RMH94072.1 flagellar type III secretion system protein FlhA [Lysobacter pythonis]
MKALWDQLWGSKRDLALIALVLGVLVVLFVPTPSPLLDLLLVLNITLALLILLVTFFTETPLKFSTFPTILLLATLLRLSLNVSATRLILNGADAGRVINAIGEFVIGGNYVVGVVVFLILVVVQYIVVTSGAQRVAEVAARFILDSMPGKQMSIDADMNMGLIDQHEARQRRALIEKEANFYGAMDGATKFVKGDAIAGIVIILVNIIGGLSIGIVQMGMSWGEAVQRFTLLTIGDGIVTQIPSLIIATATGIIITRAAADAHLGSEIPKQVAGNPKSLAIVGLMLLVMLAMPGFPKWPVLLAFAMVAGLVWFIMRKPVDASSHGEQANGENAIAAPESDEIQQALRVEPVEIRLGTNLAQTFIGAGSDLPDRINNLRKQLAQDLGFVLPKVQTRPQSGLPADGYEIHFQGSLVGKGELRVEQVMAIDPGGARVKLEGEKTQDPTYGLPAQWISADLRQFARNAGYTLVDPDTVLMTHLSELVKRQSADLLTRADTEQVLQRLRGRHDSLIDDLIPNVLSYSEVQRVLQLLLREQVSIRHIEAILEVLVDVGRTTKIPEELAERTRERLGPMICQPLRDAQGELQVLTLAPDVERALLGNIRVEGRSMLFDDVTQLDGFMKNLGRQVEAMMGKNLAPILLCPSPLRRSLRGLLHRSMPYVSVLSVTEVPPNFSVRAFATVHGL